MVLRFRVLKQLVTVNRKSTPAIRGRENQGTVVR